MTLGMVSSRDPGSIPGSRSIFSTIAYREKFRSFLPLSHNSYHAAQNNILVMAPKYSVDDQSFRAQIFAYREKFDHKISCSSRVQIFSYHNCHTMQHKTILGFFVSRISYHAAQNNILVTAPKYHDTSYFLFE